TVVTANYGRFRRRIVLAALVAVLVVAAGVTSGVLLTHRGGAPAAAPVPGAVLPAVPAASAVLPALSTTAPRPDPQRLSAVLAPLLADPALGSGVGAQVTDVASGTVLADDAAATPATPASTAKLLTSVAV